MPMTPYLGKLFAALEDKTKLSGTDMAKRLGVTPCAYYAIRGTLKKSQGAGVSTTTLDKVEEAFGWPLFIPNPALLPLGMPTVDAEGRMTFSGNVALHPCVSMPSGHSEHAASGTFPFPIGAISNQVAEDLQCPLLNVPLGPTVRGDVE